MAIALGALVILLLILVAACRPYNPNSFPECSPDKPGSFPVFLTLIRTYTLYIYIYPFFKYWSCKRKLYGVVCRNKLLMTWHDCGYGFRNTTLSFC